jgi:hypothetical protein
VIHAGDTSLFPDLSYVESIGIEGVELCSHKDHRLSNFEQFPVSKMLKMILAGEPCPDSVAPKVQTFETVTSTFHKVAVAA